MSFAQNAEKAALKMSAGLRKFPKDSSQSCRWFQHETTGDIVILLITVTPRQSAPVTVIDGSIQQPGNPYNSMLVSADSVSQLASHARDRERKLIVWWYSYDVNMTNVHVDDAAIMTIADGIVRGKSFPDDILSEPVVDYVPDRSESAVKAAPVSPQSNKTNPVDKFEKPFFKHHTERTGLVIRKLSSKKLHDEIRAKGLHRGQVYGDIDSVAITEDGRILPIDIKCRRNNSQLSIGLTDPDVHYPVVGTGRSKYHRPADSLVGRIALSKDYEVGLRAANKYEDKVIVGSPHQNAVYDSFARLTGRTSRLPVAILAYPSTDVEPSYEVDQKRRDVVTPGVSYRLCSFDDVKEYVERKAFHTDYDISQLFE